MTRKQCEAKLVKHMEEMVKILKQYNPESQYLSCSYFAEDGTPHISINNRCYHDGEDVMRPINCFKRGEDPICSYNLV